MDKMKKYFEMIFLTFFCTHDWELENTSRIYENSNSKNPYLVRRTYICKKCGKFKQVNL